MNQKDKKPETVYNERIERFNGLLKQLKKKDTVLSIVKLVLFVTGFFVLFKFFSRDPVFAGTVFGIFFIFFVAAVVFHETVLDTVKRYKTLRGINETELQMLRHEFPSAAEGGDMGGDEFKDPDHAYTSDLDIFGDKSVFHYINRTVTTMGRETLARWMRGAAGVDRIKERQEAVRELAAKLDFRQNFQAHGMAMDDTAKKLESLYRLFDEPFFIEGKRFLIIFIHVLPVVTLGLFVLAFFNWPLIVPLVLVLFQLLINNVFLKETSRVYGSTSRNFKILKAYSGMIEDIEDEPFDSPRLNGLKKELDLKERNASYYIRRLAVLLQRFEVRSSGTMYLLVNGVLLWDLHCVYRIEKWRREMAPVVPRWFDVIGNMEGLSCFGNLWFNSPGWSFPGIHDEGGFRLNGGGVGHPLIPGAERVCNDIVLEEGKKILMVTGPNMAGKSTFLRTVGVNMVFAMAGAPVCAEYLEISPVRLVTSMQTSDSLDKHLSLFYAELQRLKMILDAIKGQDGGEVPVFFMIDEMLKGTNALDRQKGSIVLVRQLVKLLSNGIVATHDLELTKLEAEEDRIINYHFDGYIEEDKLLFDYKFKRGICESFNAVVLMKKIGIDL